ncbi:MAG: hypothetical protein R6X32_04650 [Chloroflexota bacterium]
MNPTLTVTDPLAEAEVTIVVTLPAPAEPTDRDERPALVTVGVAGRPPVSQNGRFADLPHLIGSAWTAFGARMELQAARTEAGAEEAVIAAAEVGDTAVISPDNPALPASAPIETAPRPANLSLF